MVLANPLGTLLPWALNAGPKVNKPTVPTAGNLLPQTGSTVPRGSIVPTTVSSAMAPKGPGNVPTGTTAPSSSAVTWPGQSASTTQDLPHSNPIPGMGPYSGYGNNSQPGGAGTGGQFGDNSPAARWYAGVGKPWGQPIPKGMGPNATIPGAAGTAVAAALTQIGDPYIWGAGRGQGSNSNPTGFDCSGYTQWAYARAGIQLAGTADTQFRSVRKVDQNHMQVGDLVFFNFGRLGAGHADHVAIYIGGGRIASASNPRVGVVNRTLDGAYLRAVIGAGRPT